MWRIAPNLYRLLLLIARESRNPFHFSSLAGRPAGEAAAVRGAAAAARGRAARHGVLAATAVALLIELEAEKGEMGAFF